MPSLRALVFRVLLVATPVVAALLLAACGGGGGAGDGSGAGLFTVRGAVVLRDGTTQDLGGVVVRDLGTGASAVTSATGAFSLGTLPAGALALQVVDPAAAASTRDDAGLPRASGSGSGGDDDPATHDAGDDDGDDHGNDGDDDEDPGHDAGDDDGGGAGRDDGDDDDTGDDDFDLSGVDDGDVVEVEIEVHGGRITALRLSHSRLSRQRAELRLTRAATSDDADVTGKARLESRSDRQRFDVEAEHLAPGRGVELVVIDPSGLEESQGLRNADAFGEAEWELHSNDGDRLPFGVASAGDLEGFRVEVRDGLDGTVLLTGSLPGLPDALAPGAGASGGSEARGRARLTRAPGATGEATVELRHREGRERFQVEISGQTPPLTVEVWLAHPTTGTLTLVGTFGVGSLGHGELERDTHDGATLPFAVAAAADLAGLAVELRNAAGGAVLFSGTTPALVVR